ncbi:MAG: hypothetical protein NVS2B9_04580 [Myxococcales bacterium]
MVRAEGRAGRRRGEGSASRGAIGGGRRGGPGRSAVATCPGAEAGAALGVETGWGAEAGPALGVETGWGAAVGVALAAGVSG